MRTPDGDLLLCGHVGSPATIGDVAIGEPGSSRLAYVARLAPDGRTRWLRQLVGERDTMSTWCATDAAGERLVVVGTHIGALAIDHASVPATPNADCYIASLDARTGAAQWARGCGASKVGYARRVVLDETGAAYVTGEIGGRSELGPDAGTGVRGWFVAKLDRGGALRWATRASRDPNLAQVKGLAVAGDAVWLAGSISGAMQLGEVRLEGGTDLDAAVAELDAETGRVRWARVFGGTGLQYFNTVERLDDGRLVVAGGFERALDIAGRRLVSAGIDAVIATFDRRGEAVRAWHVGSPGNDGMIDAVVVDSGAVFYGRAYTGLAIDGVAVATPPDLVQVLVHLAGDGATSIVPVRGSPAAPRSVTRTPGGGLLLAGRFDRTLAVFDAQLAAERGDGFAIELRGSEIGASWTR